MMVVRVHVVDCRSRGRPWSMVEVEVEVEPEVEGDVDEEREKKREESREVDANSIQTKLALFILYWRVCWPRLGGRRGWSRRDDSLDASCPKEEGRLTIGGEARTSPSPSDRRSGDPRIAHDLRYGGGGGNREERRDDVNR